MFTIKIRFVLKIYSVYKIVKKYTGWTKLPLKIVSGLSICGLFALKNFLIVSFFSSYQK